MNTDDLIRQMEEDDIEYLEKMSVREYAKYKKMEPQLVYYYIRKGDIIAEACVCGRKVIDVATADKFLDSRVQRGQKPEEALNG